MARLNTRPPRSTSNRVAIIVCDALGWPISSTPPSLPEDFERIKRANLALEIPCPELLGSSVLLKGRAVGEEHEMKALEGVVTEQLSAGAGELFELITNVERLPEWNAHIHHVVTAPPGPVRPGDEWLVAIRVFGRRWNSRSRALQIDPDGHRLTVISQTDDGNPSYTRWEWQVIRVGEGSEVSVRWELNPKTFWRRVLFARIRHRQLRTEVGNSLRAAERAAG